ncbi:hypothetical protein BDQ12DRAFT_313250 [Crucibulum laeve]|uniref:Uncharacterized protein n=1 Tax=Crucibulum laeve TaxID=68775 RepID=A0A5C3LS18_9AGAR|nr:hypothetical protein BDQ12DRAFT_313250 [Crucibulum laeve]
MGVPLRRSETLMYFPSTQKTPVASTSSLTQGSSSTSKAPRTQSLQAYKEERLRQKALTNPTIYAPRSHAQGSSSSSSTTTTTAPALPSMAPAGSYIAGRKPLAPPPVLLPVHTQTTARTNSPLSPHRAALPGRPIYPRSKHEPNLYRKAITTCIKRKPGGEQILKVGVRKALGPAAGVGAGLSGSVSVSVAGISGVRSATIELEKLVAATKRREDRDVLMADATSTLGRNVSSTPRASTPAPPVMSKSWVVVQGEDWEMVDV